MFVVYFHEKKTIPIQIRVENIIRQRLLKRIYISRCRLNNAYENNIIF